MIETLKNNRNTIGNDLNESPVEEQPKFNNTEKPSNEKELTKKR